MRKTNVRKLNKVSCPFFQFSGYNSWRNLKDIPSFLRAVHTLFKDGVPPQAYYDTYAWFIDVMEMIVKWYRDERAGTPFILEEEIKVGDVVTVGGGDITFICTKDNSNGDYTKCHLVAGDGSVYEDCDKFECQKTGKSIDIGEILKEIDI